MFRSRERLSTNEMFHILNNVVKLLKSLVPFPNKIWRSQTLAKKEACTGSAATVRKSVIKSRDFRFCIQSEREGGREGKTTSRSTRLGEDGGVGPIYAVLLRQLTGITFSLYTPGKFDLSQAQSKTYIVQTIHKIGHV
jgi:hypothetical protein